MKLLNLDEIALDSQRTVKYKGKEYKVRDFNVSEFIQFQKHFNAFTKHYNSAEEGSMDLVVQETKELVAIGVPDFPQDEVDELNPVQMLALVSMIANLIPDADEAADEGEKPAPKKAKGTKAK